jgi:hypothetical protein
MVQMSPVKTRFWIMEAQEIQRACLHFMCKKSSHSGCVRRSKSWYCTRIWYQRKVFQYAPRGKVHL